MMRQVQVAVDGSPGHRADGEAAGEGVCPDAQQRSPTPMSSGTDAGTSRPGAGETGSRVAARGSVGAEHAGPPRRGGLVQGVGEVVVDREGGPQVEGVDDEQDRSGVADDQA